MKYSNNPLLQEAEEKKLKEEPKKTVKQAADTEIDPKTEKIDADKIVKSVKPIELGKTKYSFEDNVTKINLKDK